MELIAETLVLGSLLTSCLDPETRDIDLLMA